LLQVFQDLAFISLDQLAVQALIKEDIHKDIPCLLSLKAIVDIIYAYVAHLTWP
jgi:hypothetical protein